MLQLTQSPAPLATHKYHQSNYFAILDEVDPPDYFTILASNKGRGKDDATTTMDKWTDEESTDDGNMPWEQSIPIIYEGNNQEPYLPSSPVYKISIPAVTHIIPIIIPPPISIPTRSNAKRSAIGIVCSHPR